MFDARLNKIPALKHSRLSGPKDVSYGDLSRTRGFGLEFWDGLDIPQHLGAKAAR
jgi:hypothetical protein